MIDPQYFINLLLFSFGCAGASDSVQCAAYGRQQHRRVAVSLKDSLKRRPASDVSGAAHHMDDRIEQLMGEHGDEDMSIHSPFELVMVGTKPEIGFQHPEGFFRPGKGHVQLPQAFTVKAVMVGAEHIATQQIGVASPCFFGALPFDGPDALQPAPPNRREASLRLPRRVS